jgi:hypothetical protein
VTDLGLDAAVGSRWHWGALFANVDWIGGYVPIAVAAGGETVHDRHLPDVTSKLPPGLPVGPEVRIAWITGGVVF